MKIEFIDLHAQRSALGDTIPEAITRVLQHGQFVFGPEVQQLESQLASLTQAKTVVTCGNGTDALTLLLLAQGVKPNDAIFVPTFTFASTAEMIALLGATPVFVDICPDTFNLDPGSLKQALETLPSALTPKGIITVDLFGLPADYPLLHEIAKAHRLWVIADAAQSFGGAVHNQAVGTLSPLTTTSFFPSKPLGCYGDGGALFIQDPTIADQIRSLRNHGAGEDRYDHIRIGLNSRLDTLQAAILLEKLKIFPKEREKRQQIADFYQAHLPLPLKTPYCPKGYTHAWGLYTVLCPPSLRNPLLAQLQKQGVPCSVYYRKPLHLQKAYQHFPRATRRLKDAEILCQQVLSFPMHPYLTEEMLEYIVTATKEVLAKNSKAIAVDA